MGIDTRGGDTPKIASVEDQANASLYKNKEGIVYAPSTWFEGALIKAGSSYKVEGRKTFKDILKSSIFIDPIEIPLITTQEEPLVFSRVLGKKDGSRIEVANARYNDWGFKFQITTTDQRLDAKYKEGQTNIEAILKFAGANFGIGGWRPKFGRFEVTKFEI